MESKAAQYARIESYPSDISQKMSAFAQANDRWTFINRLPFDVELRGVPVFTTNELVIAKIPAYKNISTKIYANGTPLSDSDVLYVKNDKGVLLMPSYVLRDIWKRVDIGASSYDPLPGGYSGYVGGFAPDSSITGIYVHNYFLFPVDIYYRGQMIAQVHGYDNVGPSMLGGSKSVVYINYSWDGFRLGDIITFKISGTSIILYEVQLMDLFQKDIQLGVINSAHDGR